MNVAETAIAGVCTEALRVIAAPGGSVLHLLRGDFALMPPWRENGFGEIYFSEVLPGQIKGWKLHTRQTQLFAVPCGLLKIALYDDREKSPTRGRAIDLLLGRPEHYSLLRIPPGIWHVFMAVGPGPALLCNLADLPHDPAESKSLPPDAEQIPYSFSACAS